jgi:hypothetical protein
MSDPEKRKNKIIAFCAIPKTGTITLVHLLRRHFGIRHFDCVDRHRPPGGNKHLAEDLRYDLGLHPWAKSIAGHGLMPFVDYQELQSRLVWYTMLRDPTARYISQYKYEVAIGRVKEDFATWMKDYPRDNFQVRWLTGEENLEAAREMVLRQIRAVGLVERYDESLLIFRHRLGIPRWDVRYDGPRNVAGNQETFKDLPDILRRCRDEIVQRNALDILLYEFVRDEAWPSYVADYGGRRKLENDLKTAFARGNQERKPSVKHLWHTAMNRTYRNVVYKPLAKLDRFRKRRERARGKAGRAN